MRDRLLELFVRQRGDLGRTELEVVKPGGLGSIDVLERRAIPNLNLAGLTGSIRAAEQTK